MGEGRGKGGVGRGKGRGSTRLLGVLPAARRRQVGVHRVARALEEARRLRHAAAHTGPLLGRGFGRGCGAVAAVAEEAANCRIEFAKLYKLSEHPDVKADIDKVRGARGPHYVYKAESLAVERSG